MSLPRLVNLSPYKVSMLVAFIQDCGNDTNESVRLAQYIIQNDRNEAHSPITLSAYRIAWSLIKCGARYERKMLFTLPQYGDILLTIDSLLDVLLYPIIEYWSK